MDEVQCNFVNVSELIPESSCDSSEIEYLGSSSDSNDGGAPCPTTPQQPQEESGNCQTTMIANGGGNKNPVKEGTSRDAGPGENNNEASSAPPSLTKLNIQKQLSNDEDKLSQDDLYSRVKMSKRSGVKPLDYGFFDFMGENDDEDLNKNHKKFKKRKEESLVPSRPGHKNSHFGEVVEKPKSNLNLLELLNSSLVGQDYAIRSINSAITRRLNHWIDENHPMVFLFLGSSGIGKTELAKLTADYLCEKKDVNGFIRIDMSEYQEQHSVARFIGAPPGYIGHENGGHLTNTLRKYKKAMVLFDEVDKAHPDILTILLQLFDEGRLTDSLGNTVIVNDSIFVMTSNLGTEEISEHVLQLREESEKAAKERLAEKMDDQNDDDDDDEEEIIEISPEFQQEVIRKILKAHFKRDDFLGRINDIIYFYPFSSSEIRQLIGKELRFWAMRARRVQEIELKWDESVLRALSQGYNIHYGARSIKHYVERMIVNPIAEADEKQLIQKYKNQQVLISAFFDTPDTDDQKISKYKFRLYVKSVKESRFRIVDLDKVEVEDNN